MSLFSSCFVLRAFQFSEYFPSYRTVASIHVLFIILQCPERLLVNIPTWCLCPSEALKQIISAQIQNQHNTNLKYISQNASTNNSNHKMLLQCFPSLSSAHSPPETPFLPSCLLSFLPSVISSLSFFLFPVITEFIIKDVGKEWRKKNCRKQMSERTRKQDRTEIVLFAGKNVGFFAQDHLCAYHKLITKRPENENQDYLLHVDPLNLRLCDQVLSCVPSHIPIQIQLENFTWDEHDNCTTLLFLKLTS